MPDIMPKITVKARFAVVFYLLRWIPVASLAGILGGTASAILLSSLDWATRIREAHTYIILLLPVAGFAIGCMYHYLGKEEEAGNNLLLEEIHSEVEAHKTIRFRMTPLILLGTFLTHLFGGSSGREGTALQTGASLADQLAKPFRLNAYDRRVLLMAGISAGFSSVFGTPLAGAVFGLEVLVIGESSYGALIPCFIAAFVGDMTTRAWHVHHTIYRVSETPAMNVRGLALSALAGIVFGLVALSFSKLTHGVDQLFKRYIKWAPFRPLVGGIIVAAAVFAIHTTKYIGLGIPTIQASFTGTQPPWDWAVKLLFTAVTLGAAFKGGEVTPLIFIGATLGNALAYILPIPSSLLAGMGFVAVFAGASNTPIASTLMAVELFGAEAGAYAAIACVFSYLFSGHRGIYRAQRIGSAKHH
jgi:H+/Cl- antiporter ClcA